jgi:hypothetical protein
VLLGDPRAIHASIPRRQQTDKRDAKHVPFSRKTEKREY